MVHFPSKPPLKTKPSQKMSYPIKSSSNKIKFNIKNRLSSTSTNVKNDRQNHPTCSDFRYSDTVPLLVLTCLPPLLVLTCLHIQSTRQCYRQTSLYIFNTTHTILYTDRYQSAQASKIWMENCQIHIPELCLLHCQLNAWLP